MPVTHDADGDRFLECVARYLDCDLDEKTSRWLNDTLLRDPARRSQFVDFCIQSQLIREYGEPIVTANDPAGAADRVDAPRAATKSLSWRRVAVLGAVAATVLIALWSWPRLQSASSVASLHQIQGSVFVTTRDQARMPVAANAMVHDGETIILEGPRGRASLLYADGTELRIAGDSSLTIGMEGQQIRLAEGTLTASVAPRPADRPLTLLTACASVRVLGTVFSIVAAQNRTDLSVDEGRVQMTRTADGATVQLSQGEFVVADPTRKLVVRDIPRPPDEWGADFEAGMPPEWRQGTFEAKGLPTDSQGAVRAARVVNENGVFYQVASPKKWSEGIFSIHDDSHLVVTFKLDRPDWFQIFIGTRPFDPDLPSTFLYRFKDDRLWKWSNRGRWLRATIPLAAFERVPERNGTPPLGEVPYELLFSARGEDRGMVIDRVWVQRRGPGKIVIEELEP